jgi:UDP-2,3-diacylglucosamine pyrophosphatase LpxH
MKLSRLGWVSDLHWDFCNPGQREIFQQSVAAHDLSALVVTGDIATRRRLPSALSALDQLAIPVYFVTGNHDYYAGSFATVDEELRILCTKSRNLTRLDGSAIIHIAADVALVGHGGWADGQAGLGSNTLITMNDSWLIKDLLLPKPELFRVLRRLGKSSADYMAEILPQAARQARRVIVATHVPPFPQACLHEGKPATADYLPHYVNQAMGEVLVRIAIEYPAVSFEVIAGHTHERCQVRLAPNLMVRVAAAEPSHPRLEEVLEF